ncbi:MAG: NAD(P)/FAD-dependent oxidoreductase [Christensenellales bacterium]|jgi:NADPH-dependent 2,4-dienoyl-CoA reductase/sulfur reductase-like enzyme
MADQTRDIDLIVIGAGPAGLAAAIATRRAGVMDLAVLEREEEPGGILNQCIHNGFGLHRFKEELTGPEYAWRDIQEARELDIDIRCGTMALDITADKVVTAVSRERGLETFRARAIILAMGCRERPRGALAIPGTRPAGVFSAGTAQKMVNMMGYMPGREVVILGSGDIGLIMARRMTLQGARVRACVELMPYSSGLNRNIVQCLEDYDIPLLLSHTVVDVKGRNRVTGVTIARVGDDRLPIPGTQQDIPCDTLLLSVGLIPENELSLSAGVSLAADTQGPVVNNRFETNVPGIFACGNVLHVHDLVDFVSQESALAGQAAARAISGYDDKAAEVPVVDGPGVRGTVPQRLLIPEGEAPEATTLMFRPDRVYHNHHLHLIAGDRVLYSQRRRIMTPGEMASVDLTAQMMAVLRDEASLRLEISPEKRGV